MRISRRSITGLLAGSAIASLFGSSGVYASEKTKEKTVTKVLEGAEPFYFKGNDTAVLVVHGFTGSTQSMRYYGEQLNKKFGFTVSGPRLKGHGTSVDDMATTGYLDWVGSAEAALNELAKSHKKVFVTGLSMGGTITLSLAERFPKIVAGIAPINAVAGIVSDQLSGLMMDAKAPARIPGIGADIKAKGVTELAYKEVPLSCLKQIYLFQAVTGNLLHAVQCPSLIIQSKEDHVVDPKNGGHILGKISSKNKELINLENSYHVATLDNDKDLIVEKAGQFFKKLSS